MNPIPPKDSYFITAYLIRLATLGLNTACLFYYYVYRTPPFKFITTCFINLRINLRKTFLILISLILSTKFLEIKAK
jgi:hypothetical protein